MPTWRPRSPGAANAIFFNHGQCCNAGSRLYVQSDVFDEVVAGVADDRQGDQGRPRASTPTREMGPLVSDEQFEQVLGLPRLRPGGGRQGAPTGGDRSGDRGYFVQPTVLTDTTNDMKVVREEIFGPVVCAMPFDERRRDRRRSPTTRSMAWPRACGRATSPRPTATAKRLRAGTVWINCYHVFDAALPFGGYKQSGWGREMGQPVLTNYLETKSVVTAL